MNIKEIFFSYQAEGPYIGCPTVFVRFAGCNLSCCYCDTKYAKKLYKAQEEAKKAKKRIWSVEGYVTEEGFNMSVWLDQAS